jgi:hypothetical protein
MIFVLFGIWQERVVGGGTVGSRAATRMAPSWAVRLAGDKETEGGLENRRVIVE